MSTIEVQKPPPPFCSTAFLPRPASSSPASRGMTTKALWRCSARAGTTASPLMVRTSR